MPAAEYDRVRNVQKQTCDAEDSIIRGLQLTVKKSLVGSELAQSGDVATLGFSFAFSGLGERYRDVER
jgi:hypothetical protein